MFKVPHSGSIVSHPAHKKEKYELATHTVKVRRTGVLADVMAIWDLPGVLMISPWINLSLCFYFAIIINSCFISCKNWGHSDRVVTLLPPTSEIGVRFPARPQVGNLVVACC